MTLTTDFGLRDAYVAEIKGVLLSLLPDVRIVDVTHQIGPQDVLGGAFALDCVLRVFPEGTVHVAVVDPGVGTDRRILMGQMRDQWVICPDNGLITWAWRRLGPAQTVYELTWRPASGLSATFHGRDIIAPAAARLAAGESPARLGTEGAAPMLLDAAPLKSLKEPAKVIHIDHFGNATTNLPGELLAGATVKSIGIGRRRLPLGRTYADAPIGKPIALIGSAGMLEIAVRNGNAARELKIEVGNRVQVLKK